MLAAAIAELAASGYAGFRMDAVARRAAVNKTTIYRRWPTRAALVAAVVDRMRTPLRDSPLPDTGRLESDLLAAFTRRYTVGRRVEGRAWARLVDERRTAEVAAIVGSVLDERTEEWRSMITRAVGRRELPRGTDPRLVLDLVRAIADSRSAAGRLDTSWLRLAIRTVLAGARAGALTPQPRTRAATAKPPRHRGRRLG